MAQQVITLLSAQGSADISVAVAKAALAKCAPGAAIIDISHSVRQNDLRQAAYILLSAYRHFPKGTVHVVPVDVFSGRPHRLLLAEADGFYFIAPDNGFIPLLLPDMATVRLCYELLEVTFGEWMVYCGRIIEAIFAGNISLFKENTSFVRPHIPGPRQGRDGIDCTVLHIDRFGNVVLDITERQFNEMTGGRPFTIKLMRAADITTLSNNYNDVPEEQPLARINAAGFLEIAFNRADAATVLGLSDARSGAVRYTSIKIFTTLD